MKLYREVKIESAEQAEALPIGTVALDHPTGNADRLPYVKATAARWASVWGVDDLGTIDAYGTAPNDAMVGDRALVPIEAEEETRTTPVQLQDAINHMASRMDQAAATGMLPPDRLEIQQQTRMVTPWRDAT